MFTLTKYTVLDRKLEDAPPQSLVQPVSMVC